MLCLNANAQKTEWNTEFQSEYIDISGISTLREPSQIITIQYTNRKFFLDAYYSFSWADVGKTIQSYAGPGIIFNNRSGDKSLAFKTDFAFNRVIGDASFIRPMLLAKWKLNTLHTLSFVGWHFWDTRRKNSESIDGLTAYISHDFQYPLAAWKISNEVRTVFSLIYGRRDVIGITDDFKFVHLRSRAYFLANAGYTFYASDGSRKFIWNVGAGITF